MIVRSDHKLTKNEKRRLREKKQKELEKVNNITNNDISNLNNNNTKKDIDFNFDDIIIEYVAPTISIESIIHDKQLENEFLSIFEKFTKPEELTNPSPIVLGSQEVDNLIKSVSNEVMNETSNNTKVSKKKKKLASRLSVAELKQLVPRPDVVEAHDVTSSDPRLLVSLKATRNTVTVPRHWCAKRKYLQGKRGMEKVAFQLPEFIAETGIAKIRESVMEQEALRKSKQKARERVQPKMGRIDIDYQVLHDAFFKFQTKPKLTHHGDLYYEGKEYEVVVKDAKPGLLSAQLKEALGMTSETSPPPWLHNMQRYGPPPSYPSLKIPGLNAPIPHGATFGYHSGGWGKPPVDEYGRPIYGDVFGTMQSQEDIYYASTIDKSTKWGAITITEPEFEEESEDEEDEEQEQLEVTNEKAEKSGIETPNMYSGIASTATAGFDSSIPDVIDLRKRASGLETPESSSFVSSGQRELYQVVQEKQTSSSGQFFASEHAYNIPSGHNSSDKATEQEIDTSGQETETQSGKRKRRLDSNAAVKKLKDFKF